MARRDDFGRGLHISFQQDWKEWFEPCGWYDFSVVELKIENDVNIGRFEIRIFLLGLGVEIAWDYADTEVRRAFAEQAERLARMVGGKL